MPPAPLSLKVIVEPGCRRLGVVGELDLASAELLLQAGLPLCRHGGDLEIDMAGTTFMDGAGYAALLRLREALGDGGRLVVERPARPVRRVLELLSDDGAGPAITIAGE